jgi:Fur family ferric uptake transcriptional regulator
VFEVRACPSELGKMTPEGFELEGHEVWLYGRCPDCQGKRH